MPGSPETGSPYRPSLGPGVCADVRVRPVRESAPESRPEHARICSLARGEDECQRASLTVADEVVLRRQTATRATDRMIGWLVTELLVILQSPL